MSNQIVYTFTQAVPALTWTINHGFGAKQVSDVYVVHNGQIQKILPLSVKHVSDTTVLIEFSEPRAGGARLIGASLEQWVAPTPPSETAYRFFRVRINSYAGQAVRFQSVQLMVGAVSHPLAQYLPMTTNSLPSPLVASASSVYSTFEPFNAFVLQGGGNDTYRWIHALNASTPQWIQIDLGIGHEIVPTTIKLTADFTSSDYPTSFSVLASNTGVFGTEAVLLFDSGTLTQGDWGTFGTPKTFTLLPTPWVPEVAGPSVWTQYGNYWTLANNTATQVDVNSTVDEGDTLHGPLLPAGFYTDVLITNGYTGALDWVPFLGIADEYGPFNYTTSSKRWTTWYWSGYVYWESGFSFSAPGPLVAGRYRIASITGGVIKISQVSLDGTTLIGTVFQHTMTGGFNAANLHVVIFAQFGPGLERYRAPGATAYPVLAGTGGL